MQEAFQELQGYGGYLSFMEDEGIIARFDQSENVTVPKFNGVNNPKYMKNAQVNYKKG